MISVVHYAHANTREENTGQRIQGKARQGRWYEQQLKGNASQIPSQQSNRFHHHTRIGEFALAGRLKIFIHSRPQILKERLLLGGSEDNSGFRFDVIQRKINMTARY